MIAEKWFGWAGRARQVGERYCGGDRFSGPVKSFYCTFIGNICCAVNPFAPQKAWQNTFELEDYLKLSTAPRKWVGAHALAGLAERMHTTHCANFHIFETVFIFGRQARRVISREEAAAAPVVGGGAGVHRADHPGLESGGADLWGVWSGQD